MAIELVQILALPQRGGEPGDLLADIIGIALGLWIGERRRSRRLDEDPVPSLQP